ncbi:ATP-binding protein [Desulfopila sp. IMCC35008]|uniref:sensor histidine kinase n=1 Tax=Desulfopila sp. IMCC35008 TaxID=2653858 RepID=UPI0013D68AA5|nr:ATP-binding protein [Desulfopila sp. IMCC35008]
MKFHLGTPVMMNFFNTPGRALPDRQRYVFILALCLVVSALTIWAISVYVRQLVLSDLRRQGESRAGFYSQSLKNNLEKNRHLPYILSRDQRIRDLLEYQVPSIRVNPHLEDFQNATGSLLFIMDDGGTVLATSNWRSPQSLMGFNFNFRPYFASAKDGEAGGYFTFGLRTKKPGYFLSYPVLREGRFLGAVAVKVDVLPLQEDWKEGGESIMVSDGHGVVILSSREEWRYRSLKPLLDTTKNRLRRTQFLELPLDSLSIQRTTNVHDTLIEVQGERFLEISRQLPEYGWRLHYLVNYGVVRKAVVVSVLVGCGVIIIFFLLLLYVRERRQKKISGRQAREAERIRSVNVLLQQEIEGHKETADNLRRVQQDLVQASKLAALGRMSAAVAHELNQPVTAIRMFAASIRKLLAREQYEKADKTLDLISGLTDRMALLTGQLKTFSRKDGGRGKPVDMKVLIERVLKVMEMQLHEERVAVRFDVAEGEPIVFGNELRIEQVFVNLINNSVDALRNCSDKELGIDVKAQDDKVILRVRDNGCGIKEEVKDFLFEPFFTTKQEGEGLGLGLSISYGIVRDLGGEIKVANLTAGGAEFRVEFQRYMGQE